MENVTETNRRTGTALGLWNSPDFDRHAAYALLRFTMGVNMAVHGGPRLLNGAGNFADGVVKTFADTPLPEPLVRLFALAIPPVELAIGLLLIVGLWTRASLIVGALLMVALMFGTGLRAQWDTVAILLLYSLVFSALLFGREHNRFAVDSLKR